MEEKQITLMPAFIDVGNISTLITIDYRRDILPLVTTVGKF